MEHHTRTRHRALLFIVGAMISLQAWGQTAEADANEQTCREMVAKFQESMSFVRKSVGYEKAAEIKESLLPNKLESELFAKEGYCGVARYLKAKKLLNKS
jgi:aspartate ammonia-lyase